MRTSVVISLLFACSAIATSQQLSSQSRTQEIASSFNKYKSAVKEKHGIRTEKYKDVRSEPVVKQNVQDYAGVYEVPELGYLINIQVGTDGRVQASGHETNDAQQSRGFSLENAKIDGALL